MPKTNNILIDRPTQKHLIILTWIGLIATIVVSLIMQPFESLLTATTSYSTVDFEFMWSVEHAQEILTAWGPILQEKELIVTYIDFLFMPAYGLAIYSANLLITRKIYVKKQNPHLAKLGCIISIFSWIAIIFDIIENINLLIVLALPSNIPIWSPILASICATIKFSFIILALGYTIIGGIFSVCIQKKHVKN